MYFTQASFTDYTLWLIWRALNFLLQRHQVLVDCAKDIV